MGPIGPTGLQGPPGKDGAPGLNGQDGQNGSPDTAAQVRDKLVTVDGAGSGVDADLLDGLSSDAFPRAGAQTAIAAERSLHWYSALFRTTVPNEVVRIGALQLERVSTGVMRACATFFGGTPGSAAVVAYVGNDTTEVKTTYLATNAAPCTGNLTLNPGRDFRVEGAGSIVWGYPGVNFNSNALSNDFIVVGFGDLG